MTHLPLQIHNSHLAPSTAYGVSSVSSLHEKFSLELCAHMVYAIHSEVG
jgi:hypothetical protein